MWEVEAWNTAIIPQPVFDPASLITGNGAFWRADVGVTQAGGQVTQWNDQSSFANNLTCTATTSTTWSSTFFNTSFPGVKAIENNTHVFKATTNFASTTCSIFFLFTPSGTVANLRYVTLDVGGANDATTPGLNCYNSASPPAFAAFSTSFLGNGGNAVSLVNGTNYLVGMVLDGANANIFLNGAVQGASTAFSSSVGGGAGCNLTVGSSSGAPMAGATYAFVGITYRALNTADWTNLKNWSNANWGTSF